LSQRRADALPRRRNTSWSGATAWSESDADVVVYIDVDLSTDLAALLPPVAALLSGTATSRSAPYSRARRAATIVAT
jgi:hypothetical protein